MNLYIFWALTLLVFSEVYAEQEQLFEHVESEESVSEDIAMDLGVTEVQSIVAEESILHENVAAVVVEEEVLDAQVDVEQPELICVEEESLSYDKDTAAVVEDALVAVHVNAEMSHVEEESMFHDNDAVVAGIEEEVVAAHVEAGEAESMFVEEEMVSLNEENEIHGVDPSELLEYHCLQDLLKKEPHKSSMLTVICKRLARAGLSVTASLLVNMGLKHWVTEMSERYWIIKDLGLGLLLVSLYEYTAQHLPENEGLYRALLTNIMHHWSLYKLLIPEQYIDTFDTLYESYVQNNHVLTLTEKESKHFVRVIKYDAQGQMKKRSLS